MKTRQGAREFCCLRDRVELVVVRSSEDVTNNERVKFK